MLLHMLCKQESQATYGHPHIGLDKQSQMSRTVPCWSHFVPSEEDACISPLHNYVDVHHTAGYNVKLYLYLSGVQRLLFMVSFGFNAAASVRVGNELGAGNPKAAAFSVWLSGYDIFGGFNAIRAPRRRFLQDWDSREKGVEGTAKEDIHKRTSVEFIESGKVIVAQIVKHEPCLISLDVEGFYDRDIYSIKYAAKIELFLPNKSDDEIAE
nr:protein ecdysoneless homolog [Tanacetum cinerariifolium]